MAICTTLSRAASYLAWSPAISLLTWLSLVFAAVSCSATWSYCSTALLNWAVSWLTCACTWLTVGCGAAPAACETPVAAPPASRKATTATAARRPLEARAIDVGAFSARTWGIQGGY